MATPVRQRPAVNGDNAFFFEALQQGKLVAQQCSNCAQFRHPPVACCPHCHSFEWQATEMATAGTVISFVVLHHPVVPPFQAGYIVGLVELDHGVRMVMNLEFPEAEVEIGMEVEVRPYRYDDELVLMAGFKPGQPTPEVPYSQLSEEER